MSVLSAVSDHVAAAHRGLVFVDDRSHDVGIEARGYPDVFSAEPDAELLAALRVGEDWVGWRALTELAGRQPAASRGAGPVLVEGPRVWLGEGEAADDRLLLACIRPLLERGSIVLATGLGPQDSLRLRRVEGIKA